MTGSEKKTRICAERQTKQKCSLQAEKLRFNRKGLQIILKHPDGETGVDSGFSAFLVRTGEKTGRRPVFSEQRGVDTWILKFPLTGADLIRGDWELRLARQMSVPGTTGTGESGKDADEFCSLDEPEEILPLSSGLRRKLLLRGMSARSGHELIFPMAGDQDRLLLRVRALTRYDTRGIWMKERAAFAAGNLLRRLGFGRGTRVIFEKFCSQAQDNGYAFFCYCMRELSPKQKKRVYYILDCRSAAWPELKKRYGRQVVSFMSFRHMLLMMLSSLYVASESRYHGYLWQTRPNPLFRDIRSSRHRILFLQHGVTALKHVEGVFGKQGYNPMTWFAVTSPREQEIVTSWLGYSQEEAPVLGFTRWDMLTDKADPADPYILLMPTWRAWLEHADPEEFASSEYYKAYRDLLEDPRLSCFLQGEGLKLRFYIHPKLADLLDGFAQQASSCIELIPYGQCSLGDLIMGCRALITDYSSVCWDAAWLDKPVLFYQFDAERYLRETGSYLDFETELPGERAVTVDSLVKKLQKLSREDWQETEQLSQVRKTMLPVRDRKNCERTEAFLRKVQ